jgi:hypothetical protein
MQEKKEYSLLIHWPRRMGKWGIDTIPHHLVSLALPHKQEEQKFPTNLTTAI